MLVRVLSHQYRALTAMEGRASHSFRVKRKQNEQLIRPLKRKQGLGTPRSGSFSTRGLAYETRGSDLCVK